MTFEHENGKELLKIKPNAPTPPTSKRKSKKPARLEAGKTNAVDFLSVGSFQDLLNISGGVGQVEEVVVEPLELPQTLEQSG